MLGTKTLRMYKERCSNLTSRGLLSLQENRTREERFNGIGSSKADPSAGQVRGNMLKSEWKEEISPHPTSKWEKKAPLKSFSIKQGAADLPSSHTLVLCHLLPDSPPDADNLRETQTKPLPATFLTAVPASQLSPQNAESAVIFRKFINVFSKQNNQLHKLSVFAKR